jgi:hypothetical protein
LINKIKKEVNMKSFKQFFTEQKYAGKAGDSQKAIEKIIKSSKVNFSLTSNPRRINNLDSVSPEEFLKLLSKVFNIKANSIEQYEPKQDPNPSGSYHMFRFKDDGKPVDVILAGGSSKGKMQKSSTAVKEGLVSMIWGLGEVIEPMDLGNKASELATAEKKYDKIRKDLLSGKYKNVNLSKATINEISVWLKNNNFNTDTRRFLNDKISVSNKLLNSGYSPSEFIIDRVVLEDIKSFGYKATNFESADKWNPSDLFLIPKGQFSGLFNKMLKATEKTTDPLLIAGILSDFFASRWGQTDKIVGISLKEQKAQGGKGKGFLKRVWKLANTYNITPEEFEWNETKIKRNISMLRKKIFTNSKNRKDINITTEKTRNLTDYKKLIRKYGALKILSNLLIEDIKKDEDLLRQLAMYSASIDIRTTNPPFFKAMGSESGRDAKVEPFETVTKVEPFGTIEISDRDTFAGLKMLIPIKLDDRKLLFDLNIRSNTSNEKGQLTIELLGSPKPV